MERGKHRPQSLCCQTPYGTEVSGFPEPNATKLNPHIVVFTRPGFDTDHPLQLPCRARPSPSTEAYDQWPRDCRGGVDHRDHLAHCGKHEQLVTHLVIEWKGRGFVGDAAVISVEQRNASRSGRKDGSQSTAASTGRLTHSTRFMPPFQANAAVSCDDIQLHELDIEWPDASIGS